MDLILTREDQTDKRTIGSLDSEGIELSTLENPWEDNEPYISCIPAGEYHCERVNSPRFGNTFQILEVPDRTHILFHWGNYEKDTLGCILLGLYPLPERDMIARSRKAFGQFIKHTELISSFNLTIRE